MLFNSTPKPLVSDRNLGCNLPVAVMAWPRVVRVQAKPHSTPLKPNKLAILEVKANSLQGDLSL
jgi:hypothetical protein